MARIIGIDLGTTNSVVAIIEDNEPVVIPNEEGSRTTPSVVAVTPEGDRLVGQFARRQAVINPLQTFFAVKRIIGRRFDDAASREYARRVPFEVIASDRGDAWVRMAGKPTAPPQVSAMVLEKMKSTAEAYLGETVDRAVVTVPAYFDDTQRQATKDAGRIAGLEVLRIINEPTAAALAYGLGRNEHERVAVFDLGGGTFDVSILVLDNGVFEVRSTNGDTFLGGEDFDNRLVQRLLEQFRQQHGVDLSEEAVPLQRLKEAAEKAKHELSSSEVAEINLPFITTGPKGPVHLKYTLTREELERLTADLIDRLQAPCLQALEDAGIRKGELSTVLLVGGMTRMPAVRRKVEAIFGLSSRSDINPDEVVALGAAVQGAVLSGEIKSVLLLDVTPLTMGIEIAGGLVEPIIPRNSTIPCRKSKVFTTAKDNQDMVRVHVIQGERPLASENKSLGRLELHGLPPAPRGLPEIDVAFELDANGIMHVEAKDLGTGKAQSLRIVSHSGLSDAEIESMLSDAELHRDEDERRKELGEARNQLEGLIYSTRRSVEEYGHALSAADETTLREALLLAEQSLGGGDLELVLDAKDQLAVAGQRLAEVLYSAARSIRDDDDLLQDWDQDDGGGAV